MKQIKRDPDLLKIAFFNSHEAENQAEHRRLAAMSHEERLEEFGMLQERAWGDAWTKEPMKKVFHFEKLDW
mgnify:CR=1 FL=1